jgi:REP-associated tyrosine transposase
LLPITLVSGRNFDCATARWLQGVNASFPSRPQRPPGLATGSTTIDGAAIAIALAVMARPLRIPDHAYCGVQRYFLTICTDDRAEYFRKTAIVDGVVAEFLRRSRTERIAIIVYCVMPDHVHLLVDGESEDADLMRFVKLAKQRTGHAFKQEYRKRLWQAGYYEHVLRNEECTEDVVLYIIENPVRKGIVQNVMDYPHWGSGIYSREELLYSIGLRRGSRIDRRV